MRHIRAKVNLNNAGFSRVLILRFLDRFFKLVYSLTHFQTQSLLVGRIFHYLIYVCHTEPFFCII